LFVRSRCAAAQTPGDRSIGGDRVAVSGTRHGKRSRQTVPQLCGASRWSAHTADRV